MENQLQVTTQNQLLKNCTKDINNISLIDATAGVKIKKLGGLKQIGDVLFILYSLTGLNKNNYPNREETILLANFIHSEFQNSTLEEIKLAFTLAIKMELSQFLGKNDSVEHFQSFSPVYFSKIMAAFKKYKAHQLKSILPKVSSLPKFKEVTDYDFLKSNFIDQFEKFKDGHYPWSYGADVMIFDLLVKHEIINIPHADKVAKSQEINKNLDASKFDSVELYRAEWSKKVKVYFFKQYIDEVKNFDLEIETIIKNKIQ